MTQGPRRKRRAVEPQPPEKARRESKYVDFKKSLNIESPSEWCELIKDIVTMANSGGGALVIGVLDDGQPSGDDCSPLLKLDPAKVVDKIAMYTGEQFADFEVRPGQRGGKLVAVIEVQGVFPPMIFVRAGTYDVLFPDGRARPKTAFNVGTLYFRHGAKSEPGNSHDLKHAIDRRLAAERKGLLANFRKVVHMPAGSEVQIIPGELAKAGDGKVVPVRLVDDPRAPIVRTLDPDQTHPFRQTELLAELNKRLESKVKVTSFHVLCVRKVHGTDAKVVFTHTPKFGTRQYSETFLEWVLDQYNLDNGFFDKVREAAARLPR